METTSVAGRPATVLVMVGAMSAALEQVAVVDTREWPVMGSVLRVRVSRYGDRGEAASTRSASNPMLSIALRRCDA
jgi:hypothetical protein